MPSRPRKENAAYEKQECRKNNIMIITTARVRKKDGTS
jgi:hypothetical protein